MSQIATCTAKRFYAERGYGFLVSEGGEDIFLHQSVLLQSGFGMPPLGAKVEIEFRPSQKSLEVTHVISIEGGEDQVKLRISDRIVPARMKFFDFRRGFGFAIAFGLPSVDIFFNTGVLDAFSSVPAPGEAVGLVLEEGERPRAGRVLRWEQVLRNGEALDVLP